MRRQAREIAFALVFEYMFTQIKNTELDTEIFGTVELTDEDLIFIKTLYDGVIDNYDYYKSKVAQYSRGFKLERIFKIDLAIIMLAMYELSVYGTTVPICVNEAVSMAKKFSTPKSVSYVNGILAEYIREECINTSDQ
ncbi:MAG: transcription antitermination factor NusB [Clostridia bacterium]|nr:transcription antitermination factor NusB [Clostridia bacterium]